MSSADAPPAPESAAPESAAPPIESLPEGTSLWKDAFRRLKKNRAAMVSALLLVAIVIAAAKTTGLANAFTQPGLWCYAASAMISGLLHSLKGNASGPK